jgi:hypothetical protein
MGKTSAGTIHTAGIDGRTVRNLPHDFSSEQDWEQSLARLEKKQRVREPC